MKELVSENWDLTFYEVQICDVALNVWSYVLYVLHSFECTPLFQQFDYADFWRLYQV